MRKRPLINPTTNDVVGILILAIKFDIVHARRLFLNHMLLGKRKEYESFEAHLTEEEKRIINCLILGFHKRKEIISILNNVTEANYNETKIKNLLHILYKKYNCDNASDLLNLITKTDEVLNIPGVNLAGQMLPVKKENN